jgi:hypothetical protein
VHEHTHEEAVDVAAPVAFRASAQLRGAAVSPRFELASAVGNRATARLLRARALAREDAPTAASAAPAPPRVLVLGLYERPFPGGLVLPAQELLIREASDATKMSPIFMGGMEKSFDKTWKPLAPSGLASATLVQEALEGGREYNIHSIYFNTAGVDLLARFPPRTSAGRMAQFPEGTFQTAAELRSVVANLAAGQHKVDVYIRHRGGLSVVHAGAQTVDGAPLPGEWAPHLPPSFNTASGPGTSGGSGASGSAAAGAAGGADDTPPAGPTPGAAAAPSEEAPPTVRSGTAPPAVAPGGRAPLTQRGSFGPPAKAPQAPPSDDARALASRANTNLKGEIDLMVAGLALKGLVAVAQLAGTLLMLTDFATMAKSAIAQRGFVLSKEREQAGNLRDESIRAQREYDKFSDDVHFMGLALFISGADPSTLGPVLDSLSDLGGSINDARIGLKKQSARVKAALKEVTAKRMAAEKIVSDEKAAAALAVATFGTAELAKIWTAYVDLDALEGALMSTDAAMDWTLDRIDDDIDFVTSWFSYLDGIAVAAGVRRPPASLTILVGRAKSD